MNNYKKEFYNERYHNQNTHTQPSKHTKHEFKKIHIREIKDQALNTHLQNVACV